MLAVNGGDDGRKEDVKRRKEGRKEEKEGRKECRYLESSIRKQVEQWAEGELRVGGKDGVGGRWSGRWRGRVGGANRTQ